VPNAQDIDIIELAREQLRDYDAHRPGSIFERDGMHLTITEAYALQFEVARLRQARGERVVGYKVGCASPTMQAQLGISEPVFGHIFETELHTSGVTLMAESYDCLALEGEFAVRTDGDAESTTSGFPVLELHNYVVRRPPLSAQELIANNAIHAGVVLPVDECKLSRTPAELLDEPISVALNGEIAGKTTGRALPEGLLGSVGKLKRHLNRFGRQLLPHQIVLTGSPLPLCRVQPGDCFEVRSENFQTINAFIAKGH